MAAPVQNWITTELGRRLDYSYVTPERVVKSAQSALGATPDGKVGPATLDALSRTLFRSLQSVSPSSPWYSAHTDAIRDIGRVESGKRISTRLWAWLAKLGLENMYPGEELGAITISGTMRPVFRAPRPRASGAAYGSVRPGSIARPATFVASGETAYSEAEAAADEKKLFVFDPTSTATASAPPRSVTSITPAAPAQPEPPAQPETPAQSSTTPPSFYEQHKTKILAASAVTIGLAVVAYAFYKKD